MKKGDLVVFTGRGLRQFVGASLVKEDEIMYQDKIKQYIYSLGEKREQFGGLSACPFAVPELESGRLFIAKIDDEHSFHDLLAFFAESFASP